MKKKPWEENVSKVSKNSMNFKQNVAKNKYRKIWKWKIYENLKSQTAKK